MATKFFLSVLFISSFLGANSQLQPINPKYNLEQQAIIMSKSLINGDYRTFVTFINPSIVNTMGGNEKMVTSLNRAMDDMTSKKISIVGITFSEPATIIKNGKELQTTLVQKTEIKTQTDILKRQTTLIAISTDNGNNWTFLDTLNKDIVTLRKSFPNLDPTLHIITQ